MATTTTQGRSASTTDVPGLGGATPFGDGGFAALRRQVDEAKISETVAQHDAAAAADPFAGMNGKERRRAEKALRRLKGSFADYPHLVAVKPREGYVFRSDYYNIDRDVACVLGFFHEETAKDDFAPFWGISRIPHGLEAGVSVTVLEQVRRMGAKWVEEKIVDSERLGRLDDGEQEKTGTTRSRKKTAKVNSAVEEITDELGDGASYLHVHNRLLVKAKTLTDLEEALEKISRHYVDTLGTVTVAAYPGEQRPELSTLFGRNAKKRGRGTHYTSTEFAGSHSLVTNGLNDPAGEYVGEMRGDVNNSAVLFDVNDYEHHVVVADPTINRHLGRCYVSDMWGSKISQSAMLNNGHVVHLVLDGADLDVLGPKLVNLTTRLDMATGDINMFEMFGEAEDELSIFPAHLDKIVLMAEQAYETNDAERAIIRGSLRETLKTFYVDKGMWAINAKEQRDRLRLVGLDHRHLPRLQDLVTYFDTEYKALTASEARDEEMVHAYNVLRMVFRDLLDNNGDLFNTHTNSAIDGIGASRRVIYDFSKLLIRGKGVAMAQLVNTVGFAVQSLGVGDTVIIHGVEHIDAGVKEYITTQLERLYARGGRVAYLYNDVEKMLNDSDFNRFDRADYTILGPMTETIVGVYQRKLGQDIPPDLERLVTKKDSGLAYLRRGVTNVVFWLDLALGINPKRAEQRARIDAAQQAAARRTTAAPKASVSRAGGSPAAQRSQSPRPTMRPRVLPGSGQQPPQAAPPTRMTPTR